MVRNIPDAIPKKKILEIGREFKNPQTQAFFYESYLTGGRVSEVSEVKPINRETEKVDYKGRLEKVTFIHLINLKSRRIKAKRPPAVLHSDPLELAMFGPVLEWSDSIPKNKLCYPRYSQLRQFANYDFGKVTIPIRVNRGGVLEFDEAYRIRPHYLRHCRATHLLQEGLSLEEVRVFLGHKDLQTLSTYSHLVGQDVAISRIRATEGLI